VKHGPTAEDLNDEFRQHFEAAREVVDFFGGDGIQLKGCDVADIGCGDGGMAFGVASAAEPASMVGYDIVPVDTRRLLTCAKAAGLGYQLPAGLRFEVCGEESLPAADGSFDFVYSWSAFEHILQPVGVLREVHRVLRPGGVVMVQVWPFYHSKHGSHLWHWFPDGFAQLLHDTDSIERTVRAAPEQGPAWSDQILEAYGTLNRVTVDDIHRYLVLAGFTIAKLELITEPVHIPKELAFLPPSLLGISGVKLLAFRE
jgi:SAM-dependent methyltransferase